MQAVSRTHEQFVGQFWVIYRPGKGDGSNQRRERDVGRVGPSRRGAPRKTGEVPTHVRRICGTGSLIAAPHVARERGHSATGLGVVSVRRSQVVVNYRVK